VVVYGQNLEGMCSLSFLDRVCGSMVQKTKEADTRRKRAADDTARMEKPHPEEWQAEQAREGIGSQFNDVLGSVRRGRTVGVRPKVSYFKQTKQ